jgi:hypothetical protein
MAKEVEFTCCNRSFPNATQPEQQKALMNALSSVPGLHVYRQDFGDQQSLAAIIKHDAPKHTMRTINSLARRHGVDIDMVNDVDESHIDNVVSRNLEGITHHYST